MIIEAIAAVAAVVIRIGSNLCIIHGKRKREIGLVINSNQAAEY